MIPGLLSEAWTLLLHSFHHRHPSALYLIDHPPLLPVVPPHVGNQEERFLT